MAGQRTLNPYVLVRLQCPQLSDPDQPGSFFIIAIQACVLTIKNVMPDFKYKIRPTNFRPDVGRIAHFDPAEVADLK